MDDDEYSLQAASKIEFFVHATCTLAERIGMAKRSKE